MDDILTETISFSDREYAFSDPPQPKEIGSGVVKHILGKGGSSVVYEIWNPKLDIVRAVKLCRPMHSERMRHRFDNEIKITAKLQHWNIVEIYAVGEWAGLPFIEMEKIDGQNLKDILAARGALPEVIATAIGLTICRALMYAHNHVYTLAGTTHRGVIHCDMKPANIMLPKNGRVKLMDFGIAHPSSISTATSGNRGVTGSLQYMSPEQLQSKDVDPRSDLYSLGVILYELYSGIKAFPAQSLPELLQKRGRNDTAPLSDFCRNLPVKLSSIVEKAMETDPEMRYQTAQEFYHDLLKTYKKKTHIPPEKLIARYLDGDALDNIKPAHDIPFYCRTAGIAIAPFLLFLAIYSFVSRRSAAPETHEITFTTPALSNASAAKQPEVAAVRQSEAVPSDVKTPKKSFPHKKYSVAARKNRVPSPIRRSRQSAGSTVAVSGQQPPDNDALLKKLRHLVAAGELTNAQRMFKEVQIENGEYHLIYAELLLKQHRWTAAYGEADKALGVPSGRANMREAVLYLKARAITAEFDETRNPQTGRKAMEAWFDLKYIYRTDTSHPRYAKADAEIRRINAELK